jgi:hypothetical protein
MLIYNVHNVLRSLFFLRKVQVVLYNTEHRAVEKIKMKEKKPFDHKLVIVNWVKDVVRVNLPAIISQLTST